VSFNKTSREMSAICSNFNLIYYRSTSAESVQTSNMKSNIIIFFLAKVNK